MPSRFETFAALHVPGDPVVLYNIWDVGSAQAVARAGAKAIATGSHPVASANGFPDGETVPIAFALANASRIIAAVELPVTVDFEGGYAVDPGALEHNFSLLAATGAIGCNFEDQVIGGEGLHPLPLQSQRIAAARRGTGANFFINARTDLFLKNKPETHDAAMVDEAIARVLAFADAGASGFFVPRLGDLKLVEKLCRASPIPVNAIAYPGAPTKAQWATAGIARISHGPFPLNALMKTFEEMARAAIN
ncbi:isocitrate lyase/phosphoenolpyruvate mutase family protein [Sphingomonas sp.]|uniref:isocitrate lyase/PEP mutase family protein n=1 Tax=Sphingomonas sp. TaxID=28214 RepID=UPI00286A1402|nr:isocitrate lyase/phosphoenolpyruvate mutase family protein [Sphingomonas sp.]